MNKLIFFSLLLPLLLLYGCAARTGDGGDFGAVQQGDRSPYLFERLSVILEQGDSVSLDQKVLADLVSEMNGDREDGIEKVFEGVPEGFWERSSSRLGIFLRVAAENGDFEVFSILADIGVAYCLDPGKLEGRKYLAANKGEMFLRLAQGVELPGIP